MVLPVNISNLDGICRIFMSLIFGLNTVFVSNSADSLTLGASKLMGEPTLPIGHFVNTNEKRSTPILLNKYCHKIVSDFPMVFVYLKGSCL